MSRGCFVGLAGLDILYNVENVPAENNKIKTNDYETHIGGPAANAAITHALLGGESLLVTSIGDSMMGEIIKHELAEFSVEVVDISNDMASLPCISGIAINRASGSRTIWSGQKKLGEIPFREIDAVLKRSDFCLSDCNFKELSDYTIGRAKENSLPIVLDAGSWKDGFEYFLSKANYTIASSVCQPPDNADFMSVALECGSENVVVTYGGEKIEYRNAQQKGVITPKKVSVVDTSAAGDIFHGAFCYYKFSRNLSFTEALHRADEVATYSVMYKGPRQGLLEYLKLK